VIITDDRKNILLANKTALSFSGYTSNSRLLISKNITVIFPSLDNKTFRTILKNGSMLLPLKKRSGRFTDAEVKLNTIQEGRKKLFILFITKPAVRPQIRSAEFQTDGSIAADTKKLNALFDNVDVMLWSVKEDANGELYYEKVNEAFASVTNRRPDDYNGKLLITLGSEQDYKQIRHALDVAKTQQVYTYERRIEHRSQIKYIMIRLIWVPLPDGTNFYIGSGVDITASKLAQEKIQLLAHALESTSEMISITDLDNRFTFVNKAFLENYGYSEDEIINKDPSIVDSPSNPSGLRDELYRVTESGGWDGELLNMRKDGTEFPIFLSTSPIKDRNNNVIGFMGAARDITELKKTETQLKKSLREKEVLLKEVYHRVKNNMQFINSLLHIQAKTIKDPLVTELFRESQNRVRMMSLIHEKLYQSEDLTNINFTSYIRALTDQLISAYPSSARNIDVRIHSENVYLSVDQAIPCGLIINELVSNTFKYAFGENEKGIVEISLSYEGGNGKFRLSVKDNGKGFPAEINFRETDSLGMVLINNLTEQLDGTIELVIDHGTEFIIKF
jgi:PAS domain S-box-containing protein